jgi:hypothetical protein
LAIILAKLRDSSSAEAAAEAFNILNAFPSIPFSFVNFLFFFDGLGTGRKLLFSSSFVYLEQRLFLPLAGVYFYQSGKYQQLNTYLFILQIPTEPEGWLAICEQYENSWNFPHSLGAMDWKYVVLQAPFSSGSFFYKYLLWSTRITISCSWMQVVKEEFHMEW